jgi:hypothetical protein
VGHASGMQSIEKLMDRGHSMSTSDLTAGDLRNFFVRKVARIRDSTDGAPDPVYRQASNDSAFGNFRPVERDDVINISWLYLTNNAHLHPMPIWLLEVCAVIQYLLSVGSSMRRCS